MIISIVEEEDVSEERVIAFFLGRIALEIPFEQVEAFFKPEDLPRVKELWAIAEWEDEQLTKAWARPMYDKDDEDFMWWDRY